MVKKRLLFGASFIEIVQLFRTSTEEFKLTLNTLKLKTYFFPKEKNEEFKPTDKPVVEFVKGPEGFRVTLLLFINSVALVLKIQLVV